MALKTSQGYMCVVCKRIYPDPTKADACRDTHEILYLPFTHTEVNRLLNALFTGDLSLVPDSVFETLRKAQRKAVRDGIQKKV